MISRSKAEEYHTYDRMHLPAHIHVWSFELFKIFANFLLFLEWNLSNSQFQQDCFYCFIFQTIFEKVDVVTYFYVNVE